MVALVSGGSSGIGKATAELLVKKGYKVYELSRHGYDSDGIIHISADVTDEESIKSAVDTVFSREGQLNLLICNAGFGISGAVELTDIAQAKRLFDVNFFGMVRCIRAAIPLLRASGGGTIICLSSVAAPIAIPFQAYYSCTKSAINDLVLALRNELRPFRISVCAVMPGDVKTGFTSSREKSADDPIYKGAIEHAVSTMERDEQNGMSPNKVAAVIARAAERKYPAPLYTVGFKYKLFVLLSRLLPARICCWIVGKIY